MYTSGTSVYKLYILIKLYSVQEICGNIVKNHECGFSGLCLKSHKLWEKKMIYRKLPQKDRSGFWLICITLKQRLFEGLPLLSYIYVTSQAWKERRVAGPNWPANFVGQDQWGKPFLPWSWPMKHHSSQGELAPTLLAIWKSLKRWFVNKVDDPMLKWILLYGYMIINWIHSFACFSSIWFFNLVILLI